MNNKKPSEIIQEFASAWERKEGKWHLTENAPVWVSVVQDYAYQSMDETNDTFINDALFQFSLALERHSDSVNNVDFPAYLNNAILITAESASAFPITYLTAWLNAGNKQRHIYVDDEIAENTMYLSFQELLANAYIRWLTTLLTHVKPIFFSRVKHD